MTKSVAKPKHDFPISAIIYRGLRYDIPQDLDLLRQREHIEEDLAQVMNTIFGWEVRDGEDETE